MDIREFRRNIFACGASVWSFVALPRGRERLPTALAWAAGLACIVALVHRFRFGADLTDESFSIAMPYRFALGDRPFVDEISIQQTAGFILYPFVWLWVKLTGGSTYLVLFVRMLHLFVFKGTAAACVYAAARRLVKNRASALAVAFVPFAFVPHSIPNVGYNVIGMALLTAGAFLSFVGVSGTQPNLRVLGLAGFLLAVTAFAYPPMVVGPLLATPLVLAFAPSRRFAATGAFVLGGLALIVLLLPMLRYGGLAGIRRSLAWGVHSAQVHSWERVMKVPDTVWQRRPPFFIYAVIAMLVAAITRARTVIAIVVSAVTLYLVYWNREESTGPYGALHAVIYLGLAAAPMLLVAKPDARLAKAAIMVMVPSFACALAAGYQSTQGPDASCLGLHASLVLFAIAAVRALEGAKLDGSFPVFVPAAIMIALVMHCYDFQYRDAPISALTEPITDGPFKGISTSPDRAHAFAEMNEITKRYDAPPGRILILYESTGYYLFSRMKPGCHSVWEMPYGDTDGMLSYWERHVNGKGIVVRAKGTGHGVLDAVLTPPDRLLVSTAHFDVYRDR